MCNQHWSLKKKDGLNCSTYRQLFARRYSMYTILCVPSLPLFLSYWCMIRRTRFVRFESRTLHLLQDRISMPGACLCVDVFGKCIIYKLTLYVFTGALTYIPTHWTHYMYTYSNNNNNNECTLNEALQCWQGTHWNTNDILGSYNWTEISLAVLAFYFCRIREKNMEQLYFIDDIYLLSFATDILQRPIPLHLDSRPSNIGIFPILNSSVHAYRLHSILSGPYRFVHFICRKMPVCF